MKPRRLQSEARVSMERFFSFIAARSVAEGGAGGKGGKIEFSTVWKTCFHGVEKRGKWLPWRGSRQVAADDYRGCPPAPRRGQGGFFGDFVLCDEKFTGRKRGAGGKIGGSRNWWLTGRREWERMEVTFGKVRRGKGGAERTARHHNPHLLQDVSSSET